MLLLFFRILHVIACAFCVVVAFLPIFTLAEQLFLIALLVTGPALILDRITNGSPRKRKIS